MTASRSLPLPDHAEHQIVAKREVTASRSYKQYKDETAESVAKREATSSRSYYILVYQMLPDESLARFATILKRLPRKDGHKLVNHQRVQNMKFIQKF